MMMHRRWRFMVLFGVQAMSLVGAHPAHAQERTPRFLIATKMGLAPLDIERTPALMRRISPALESVLLAEALKAIAMESGIDLTFLERDLPAGKQVRLVADRITVASALTEVLLGAGMDVVYSRNGRIVVVKRDPASLVAPQQMGTIVGRVMERGTNAPVVSAQVAITGVASRYTDDKGQYRISNVPVGEHEVTVRRVGFEAMSRRVRVTDSETAAVDFTMARVATALTEVVTTATGERSRFEVGNAIGTIKADSVVPTTLIRNFSDLLTARTPGVIVSNATGAVGTPSKIRIRGINSIYLNNDPIIVIDGVRLISTVTSASSQTNVGTLSMPLVGGTFTGGTAAAPSRLDDIDPNMIESIDVLRGPSAASLYGTEAANGVIVIKTKHGAAGPFRFNVLADNGWSNAPLGAVPDFWYGWGHLPNGGIITNCELQVSTSRGSSVADGTCVQDSVTHFNPFKSPDLTTLGIGTARNLSANMSGGTEQLKEFLSVRVSDLLGMAKLSNVEQRRLARMWGSPPPSWMMHPNTEQDLDGSSRTNLRLTSNFDVSLSVNAAYRTVLNSNSGLSPAQNASTNVFLGPSDTLKVVPAENGLARQASTAKRAFASVNATYVPAQWFTLRATVGGDYTLRTDDALQRSADCTTVLNPSGCRSGHTDNRQEPFVMTADLGAQFSFTPSAWLTSRTSVGEQLSHTRFYALNAMNAGSTNLAFGTDLLTPSPVATSGTPQLFSVTESRDESATAGFYVEQTAAIRERLFLTAALRQDAASAFGPSVNKQLPVYPKFSLSWLVSDESFFPYKSMISSFRLRSAYGHSGNQANQTDILPNYAQVTALLDGVTTPGIVMSQTPNPNLRPERSTEWEGGFDASLFANERVHVEATLYRKLSKDAIVQVGVPGSIGTTNAVGTTWNLSERVNVGSVENRGMELSMTAKLIDTRAFGWELTVNMTQNSNKLVYKDNRFPAGNSFTAGYPVFGYWGGTVASYADLNGDGILEANEVVFSSGPAVNPTGRPSLNFIGAPYPKSEFTYDNVATLWSGAIRVGAKLDQVNGQLHRYGSVSAGPFTGWNVRCAVDPTCTLAQQALLYSGENGSGPLEVASSLRLSELSVTYAVPRLTARRLLHTQTASVTLAGRNLLVWSNYSAGDPNEILGTGPLSEDDSAYGVPLNYPQPRNWALRLSLGF